MVRVVVLLSVIGALVLASSADAATPQVIDGPSASVKRFADLDLAPDGTGALAYIKEDAGVEHVFVSVRSSAGVWQAPERVDTGLLEPSRGVSVAAANGGRVVVTFLNGPVLTQDVPLKSAVKPSSAAPFALLAFPDTPTARQADLDMEPSGVAYVAYSVGEAGNATNLRAERLSGTTWSPGGAAFPGAGGILDNVATHDAAPDGQRGAKVTVAPSGDAVVAWAEEGATTGYFEAWLRRLAGTTVGGQIRANSDGNLGTGATHDSMANLINSADMLDLDSDAGGNAWVVFRQLYQYPPNKLVGRLVARKLTVGVLGAPQFPDGLPDPPPEAAENPRIDVSPSGAGLLATPRQLTFGIFGSTLAAGTWSSGSQVNTLTSTAPGAPVVAMGDAGDAVTAWMHAPGGGADQTIRARYRSGGTLGAETELSNPAFGTTDAPLAAGADASSVLSVGFAQGLAASKRIVVNELTYASPTSTGGGSGTPTGGGGGEPTGTKDTTAPTVTKLRLSRRTFALGTGLPRLSAKKVATGTTITFTVSEAGTARLQFVRLTGGRKSGKKCLPASRRRKGRKCTRRTTIRPTLKYTVAAGTRKIRFQGVLTRAQRLAAGRYELRLTVTDAAGNVSRVTKTAFTLRPRSARR